VLSVALRLNDLVSFDRNYRQTDPQKYIPPGRTMSRQECLRLLPGLSPAGLTGGAIFYDAQVYNAERLLLAFLRSAAQAGADLANYVEVTGFLQEQARVTGVHVCDHLGGERFSIRAKTVVNTCGPWVNRVLGLLKASLPGSRFGKAMNLITRRLFSHYAVGLASRRRYQDVDAVFNKGSRLLFVAPWRGQSLIGTTYAVYDADPDAFQVTEHDVQDLLEEINRAYPPANLQREEVCFIHGGLVPISNLEPTPPAIQLAKHHQIRDHGRDGFPGLLSVVGVKYTTARHVAERVVDHVFATGGHTARRSVSSVMPLHGGRIEQFDTFCQTAMQRLAGDLGAETVLRLVYNYGSAYPEVLRYGTPPTSGAPKGLGQEGVLRAEILHGIRAEMAQKLADVVLRRTDLGTIGHPGTECLCMCAEIMGAELGWDAARMRRELQEVEATFAPVAVGESA
jgi:glycerol-3-phosphate dehydrogenase